MSEPTITVKHRLIESNKGLVGAWVESSYGPRGVDYTAEVGILAQPDGNEFSPMILRWDRSGNDAHYVAATAEEIEKSIRERMFVETIPPSYRKRMAEAIADVAHSIVNNLPEEWYRDLRSERERHAIRLRETADLFREAAAELYLEADKGDDGREFRSYLYADARRALEDERLNR